MHKHSKNCSICQILSSSVNSTFVVEGTIQIPLSVEDKKIAEDNFEKLLKDKLDPTDFKVSNIHVVTQKQNIFVVEGTVQITFSVKDKKIAEDNFEKLLKDKLNPTDFKISNIHVV